MKFHANFEGVTEFCHIFHFGSLSFNFIITISHQFDHVWNQGDKNFLKVKKKNRYFNVEVCVCSGGTRK